MNELLVAHQATLRPNPFNLGRPTAMTLVPYEPCECHGVRGFGTLPSIPMHHREPGFERIHPRKVTAIQDARSPLRLEKRQPAQQIAPGTIVYITALGTHWGLHQSPFRHLDWSQLIAIRRDHANSVR